MSAQVEGVETSQVDDDLNALRDELRRKNLLYVVDICKESDCDVDLQFLVKLRKKDILELIDEINEDNSNRHKVSVLKKNKFAKIISQYVEQQQVAPNDDPSKYVTSDKEERDSISKLSNRIKQISSSILSVSNTVQSVDDTVRQCEVEINKVFGSQINKLKERQKILLNELHKVGNDKKSKLKQQSANLKNKLKQTEKLYKKTNLMLKAPISLSDIDKRKELLINECNDEMNNKYNSNPNTNSNVRFIADIKYLENIINQFGNISTIATPMLLTLRNNKQSGAVMIKWDILRRNKNKNEKIKIEWILQHDIDEKKEEKVDLDEKVMELDENIKNETTITVKQVGIYEFQLSYNNGVQRQYSPKSNIKSISIVNVWKKIGTDLIIKANETKILESDIIHKFDKIIIESNGTLTTKEWNGNSGGNLVLQTYAIIIKSNAKIEVDGKGYKGGKAKNKETNGTAFQGESVNSKGSMKTSANKGGGGGGIGSVQYGGVGGGGGGYGTVGSEAEPNRCVGGNNPGGKGGDIYGDAELSELLLGSGGGSGHPFAYAGDGKVGGNGGGVIFITTTKLLIENNGLITSNGQNAPSVNNGLYVSGGGGGSGGSIYIKCKELINNGNISVIGGKGAPKGNEAGTPGICSDGGDGGYGRIRIDTGNLNKVGNVVPNVGYTAKY